MSPTHKVKAGVILLFTVLTFFQLVPLSLHLNDSVHDAGDPLLNTWIIGQMQHNILHNPGRLFDGNAFYPHKNILAYSEHFFPQALATLPLSLLLQNPILVHNILFIFFFVFSGFAMFLLVRHLTKNDMAALISGMIFAFNTFPMNHTPQLQLLSAGFFPLALLYLHRFFEDTRTKDALLFALFFTLLALSCIYYGLYSLSILAVIIPLFMILNLHKLRWKLLFTLGWPLLVSGAILALFSLPYLQLFKNTGFRRVMASGADVANYLAPLPRNLLLHWMSPLGTHEKFLLPGCAALGLAAYFFLRKSVFARSGPRIFHRVGTLLLGFNLGFGIVFALKGNVGVNLLGWRATLAPFFLGFFLALVVWMIWGLILFVKHMAQQQAEKRRDNGNFLVYTFFIFWAFLLSMGKTFSFFGKYSVDLALPFTWFYNHVPGFKGIRVPSRYGIFVILGISVLAGYGLSRILRKIDDRRARVILIIMFALLINMEYLAIPHGMKTLPVGKDIPPTYTWIRDNGGDSAIMELPIWDMSGRNSVYMYFSLFHKKPIMNGYSGFIPPSFLYYKYLFKTFPSHLCLDILKAQKVKYVVVHLNTWKKEVADNVVRRIRTVFSEDLRIVQEFNYTFSKENFLSDRYGRDIVVEVNLKRQMKKRLIRNTYRSIPEDEWTITSDINAELAQNMKDGDVTTQWSTRKPRRNGDFIQITFQKPRDVAKVSLHLGASLTDFGINFRIEISEDGVIWKEVPRAYFPSELVEDLNHFVDDPIQNIYLDLKAVRHLKIVQTQNSRQFWWTISDIDIFE